jgi:hypothetical protein
LPYYIYDMDPQAWLDDTSTPWKHRHLIARGNSLSDTYDGGNHAPLDPQFSEREHQLIEADEKCLPQVLPGEAPSSSHCLGPASLHAKEW